MYTQIAHYGGYLTGSLDTHTRRLIRQRHSLRKKLHAEGTLLANQKRRIYYNYEWLLNFELRHVASWGRLIWASKISRQSRSSDWIPLEVSADD